MSEYTPDAWVIVKIITETETIYKVMGGWYGGYGGSDSWRINSGITAIINEGDHYAIKGVSGSTYFCGSQWQRMTGLMSSVYDGWVRSLAKAPEQSDISLSIIDINDVPDTIFFKGAADELGTS